jgi:hypothetical protein
MACSRHKNEVLLLQFRFYLFQIEAELYSQQRIHQHGIENWRFTSSTLATSKVEKITWYDRCEWYTNFVWSYSDFIICCIPSRCPLKWNSLIFKSWLNFFENKTSGWSSPFDNFAYRYVLFLENKPTNSNTIISGRQELRGIKYQMTKGSETQGLEQFISSCQENPTRKWKRLRRLARLNQSPGGVSNMSFIPLEVRLCRMFPWDMDPAGTRCSSKKKG